MAPKAGKTKPHKSKGEKKKKEEKVLPTVIEISVETPDESQVTLKGISTDRILDVKKLLAVHVQTCHFNNFSLSHQVRGTRLKDSVDIISLKPCHLTIVEEDYTEEKATAHIRRLLDIVACSTAYGSSKPPVSRTSPKDSVQKDSGSTEVDSPAEKDATVDSNSGLSPKPKESEKKSVGGCESPAAEGADKGDINMCPSPRLGQFYEFFSFSHLTPPIQYIRRSVRLSIEDKGLDDFFQIDIKVSSGKPITVVASRTGFFAHSLVPLSPAAHAAKLSSPSPRSLSQAPPVVLEVSRRTIVVGLGGALWSWNALTGKEEAMAASRRPPPPPPKEKKDPTVTGVQAKVLASKKRKEEMKAAIAKLREKGKPVVKADLSSSSSQ